MLSERRDLGLGLFLGLRLLEIGDGELELLDELPAAFGGLSELLPPGLREHQFQPLDLKCPNFRLAVNTASMVELIFKNVCLTRRTILPAV